MHIISYCKWKHDITSKQSKTNENNINFQLYLDHMVLMLVVDHYYPKLIDFFFFVTLYSCSLFSVLENWPITNWLIINKMITVIINLNLPFDLSLGSVSWSSFWISEVIFFTEKTKQNKNKSTWHFCINFFVVVFVVLFYLHSSSALSLSLSVFVIDNHHRHKNYHETKIF